MGKTLGNSGSAGTTVAAAGAAAVHSLSEFGLQVPDLGEARAFY